MQLVARQCKQHEPTLKSLSSFMVFAIGNLYQLFILEYLVMAIVGVT
jgi:hypothetical protein